MSKRVSKLTGKPLEPEEDYWVRFLKQKGVLREINTSTSPVELPSTERNRELFERFLKEVIRIDRESYEIQAKYNPSLRQPVELEFLEWKRKHRY